ncbi:ParA family protein [Marinobacter sp.]|uniref:ParA family protein n=1 Tax=Marinobacter sp. TaxID=50741 RepID=UPI0035676D26
MTTQAKVIVVGNKKGGAGKTTISIHMAGTLHRYGKKVLLVEQDTQGSIADAHKLRIKYVGEPSFDYHFQPSKLDRDDLLKLAEGYDYVVVDSPPGTAKDPAGGDFEAKIGPGSAKASIRPETLYSFTAADLIVIPTKMNRTDIHSVWNYINICSTHLAMLQKSNVTPVRQAVVIPNELDPKWGYAKERKIIQTSVDRCDKGRGLVSLASTPIIKYRRYSDLQWDGKTAADLGEDRARYLFEKTLFEDVLPKIGVVDPRSKRDKIKANEYSRQTILKIYGGEDACIA